MLQMSRSIKVLHSYKEIGVFSMRAVSQEYF